MFTSASPNASSSLKSAKSLGRGIRYAYEFRDKNIENMI